MGYENNRMLHAFSWPWRVMLRNSSSSKRGLQLSTGVVVQMSEWCGICSDDSDVCVYQNVRGDEWHA